MTDFREAAPDPDLKRTRTGLIAFGVLSILFGALSGCMALLTPVAILVTNPDLPGAAPDPRSLLIGALFYAGNAVISISSGVGSIRARRWARPVMLFIGWTWLLTGILTVVALGVLAPDLNAVLSQTGGPGAELPPGGLTAILLVELLFVSLVFVAAPGSIVLFFQRASVARALERLDPTPRWTDRCPPPVLGLSLALGTAAVLCLSALGYGAFVVFGFILTGLPAAGMIVATAVVLAILTVGLYRLRPAAWWSTVALTALWTASSLWTALDLDFGKLAGAMGISKEQAGILSTLGSSHHGSVAAVALLMGVGSLVYLLYIRRHFFPDHD